MKKKKGMFYQACFGSNTWLGFLAFLWGGEEEEEEQVPQGRTWSEVCSAWRKCARARTHTVQPTS